MANIIVPVPCGRATINVTFKDGCLDKKQSRPATYSTGDPVMQAIIENSPQFGHRIFLRDTFDIPGTPEVKAPRVSKPSVSVPAQQKVYQSLHQLRIQQRHHTLMSQHSRRL